jgi:adenosylcobyric acid synthase
VARPDEGCPLNGALLVAGTGTDVGKSIVVQGLCRWLVRRGVRVAPFKGQNMSLNSDVTPDGAEIARAQSAQAAAARVPPEGAMNPVLIKPVDDTRAQVIVMGHAVCDTDAREYMELRPRLAEIVLGAFTDLRARFDVVICEGAGSLAEMNLREGDLANMGLAQAAGIPVIVIGDIDRGGVFASLYGSLGLLNAADRRLVRGFIINKFRGDISILEPGLHSIEAMTQIPILGVLPWVRGTWTDSEDAAPIHAIRTEAGSPIGRDTLDIAIVALSRMSNFTDVDPLACEPGVTVRFTRSHADVRRADLVVLPGTKATVRDLADLRASGLDKAIIERANRGGPVFGICGGYQMLGTRILDTVESGDGEVTGLRLLPIETTFESKKILARPRGRAPWFGGAMVDGYEIHNGRVLRLGAEPLFETGSGEEGCRAGSVLGTSWHGILENDQFRASLLGWAAAKAALDWRPGATRFAHVREARIDLLADLIDEHVDTGSIVRLIESESSTREPGPATHRG